MVKELHISHFILLNDFFYFKIEINMDCRGKTYENVTLTAYYPDYDDENTKGYLDIKGQPLKTLQVIFWVFYIIFYVLRVIGKLTSAQMQL